MLKNLEVNTKTFVGNQAPIKNEENKFLNIMINTTSQLKFEITTSWKQKKINEIEDKLEEYERYLVDQDIDVLRANTETLEKKYDKKLEDIQKRFQELNPELEELFKLKTSLMTQRNVLKVKEKDKTNQELLEDLKIKDDLNKPIVDEKEFEKVPGKEKTVRIENQTYLFRMSLTYNSFREGYYVKYNFELNYDFFFGKYRTVFKSIENKYDSYEEALKYYEGRLKYYKDKYFDEDKPKVDEKLIDKNNRSNFNTAIRARGTRIELKEYRDEK